MNNRTIYAENLTIEQALKTSNHFKTLGFKNVEIRQRGSYYDITADNLFESK